jgi:hypothetical protein
MTYPNILTLSRSTMIWVKWTLPGFHAWPDAPDEVAYLRSRHRHLFHFKVTLSVSHSDREVEFHMLQTWCKALYADSILELNNRSCEMIASELLDKLTSHYGRSRSYAVEVSEDDECGSVVTQESF